MPTLLYGWASNENVVVRFNCDVGGLTRLDFEHVHHQGGILPVSYELNPVRASHLLKPPASLMALVIVIPS